MTDTTKPAALVLGGVSPHIAVVERLKALGYRVVLADYKDAPPAAAFADTHLQISTLDADAVEQAARDVGATAIVNVCLDQPLPVVAAVRQALGLASPLSPDAAHRLTDKDAMKQVLREAGVDTARWVVADTPEALDTTGLRFPVVAKPVGGTGSLGVVFARDEADLAAQLDQSFAMARGGAVLVEEFVEGLGTVDRLHRDRRRSPCAAGARAAQDVVLGRARGDLPRHGGPRRADARDRGADAGAGPRHRAGPSTWRTGPC